MTSGITFMLHLASVGTAAPADLWGLNPQAVEAIASVFSAVITASALIIAVRTYLQSNQAALRSQAELVTAHRSEGGGQVNIDGVEYQLIEIHITNSSDTSVFDLCVLLRAADRKRAIQPPHIDYSSGDVFQRPLMPSWGRWPLAEGAIIPTGESALYLYVNNNGGLLFPIPSHVAVGFNDRNGLAWTRRLDGKLIKGWKMPGSRRS